MAHDPRGRLSSLALLVAGAVFGVGLMLNCGGGGTGGGVPAGAANGTFAGVLHVDPDTSGPHDVAYEPDFISEVRSVVFTPAGPHDVLLAVEVDGTYSTQSAVTLNLQVLFDDSVVVAQSSLGLPSGEDRPFQIHLPLYGATTGSAGTTPPSSVGLRAYASPGLGPIGQVVATIQRIDFRFLWLEDVTILSPTTNTAPNPLDVDADGDGFTPRTRDCDDSDATVSPVAPEIADGVDNDCDGQIDEGIPKTWVWLDADGDGYGGDTDPVETAVPLEGYVGVNGDCDDNDPTVHPGAEEVADGVDNDCDGQVDETAGTQLWYVDVDQDGYGGELVPVGYGGVPVENGFDCDDSDATVYPGAPEIPDGKDNDCDGAVDEP